MTNEPISMDRRYVTRATAEQLVAENRAPKDHELVRVLAVNLPGSLPVMVYYDDGYHDDAIWRVMSNGMYLPNGNFHIRDIVPVASSKIRKTISQWTNVYPDSVDGFIACNLYPSEVSAKSFRCGNVIATVPVEISFEVEE